MSSRRFLVVSQKGLCLLKLRWTKPVPPTCIVQPCFGTESSSKRPFSSVSTARSRWRVLRTKVPAFIRSVPKLAIETRTPARGSP